MPGTEWAIVAGVVATIVGLVLAFVGGRRGRDREAKLEGQLLQRRVDELELQVEVLEDQSEAGVDAAEDAIAVERRLVAARRVAGRAARRLGLLRAGAGPGGGAAPAPAGGGAPGPDGGAGGHAGEVA